MPFLPITKQEMLSRGWEQPDFVLVTGDAYVDHPSFGTAVVSRVLEDAGFKVCIRCFSTAFGELLHLFPF